MLRVLDLDDAGEHEDHVAALVHDGRVAVRARHLARQAVVSLLVPRVVEGQPFGAALEVQVRLVEDCCPLEGGSCLR